VLSLRRTTNAQVRGNGKQDVSRDDADQQQQRRERQSFGSFAAMVEAGLLSGACIYRYLAEGSSKCQARIAFFLKLTRACVRATARECDGSEEATQAQKPNEQHRSVLVVFAAFTICWRTILGIAAATEPLTRKSVPCNIETSFAERRS
jgi:hypothetical protein